MRDAYSVTAVDGAWNEGAVQWKPAARDARRVMSWGGSGVVRGTAHGARRETNRGLGGEQGRCAAEERGARRATRHEADMS